MRRRVTEQKLREFMREIARSARSAGNVYFTGGVTALLLGMREQTLDVDVRFDPEPLGVFGAIGQLKNRLDLNVEIASPMDFIPVADDWQRRSVSVERIGEVGFFHFDLCAQALAKIERAHGHDWSDARGFLKAGGISDRELEEYFRLIRANLERYPAIDAAGFEKKLRAFLEAR